MSLFVHVFFLKHQNITVIITDLGIETELTWEIKTDVWIKNSEENTNMVSFLGTTSGIIGMFVFIVLISVMGVAIVIRVNNNKNIKDAYDAFEVSKISNSRNGNINLPPAPIITDLINLEDKNN